MSLDTFKADALPPSFLLSRCKELHAYLRERTKPIDILLLPSAIQDLASEERSLVCELCYSEHLLISFVDNARIQFMPCRCCVAAGNLRKQETNVNVD